MNDLSVPGIHDMIQKRQNYRTIIEARHVKEQTQ